jgi:hypothetical protein
LIWVGGIVFELRYANRVNDGQDKTTYEVGTNHSEDDGLGCGGAGNELIEAASDGDIEEMEKVIKMVYMPMQTMRLVIPRSWLRPKRAKHKQLSPF